jgi:5-methyltetrahydrofolate--homocysteine methyltransferase
MDDKLQTIYLAIVDGDQDAAQEAIRSALDGGLKPAQILSEAMIPAMGEVGRLFESGECFVPEMLIAARAMQSGLSILKPLLKEGDVQSAGRIVMGTVKGDLHDIGKNLVVIMLEGSGFEIHDLGVDVPADKFVQAVRDQKPDIVGLSALLTTTMPAMKTTIDALESAGLRSQVKVMVGGAPITEAFADSIGADGFAPDASRAVTLARSLVGRESA